jgi:hypothetical protein
MMGNYHVRFLRGKGAVTRPTYLAHEHRVCYHRLMLEACRFCGRMQCAPTMIRSDPMPPRWRRSQGGSDGSGSPWERGRPVRIELWERLRR